MSLKKLSGTSPVRRFMTGLTGKGRTITRPEKPLTRIIRKPAGRNNSGKITSRHRGGGEKKLYRQMDWKRDKRDIVGKTMTIEYDPNRNADICLIYYPDGEKRYILHPEGLKIGEEIAAGENVEVKTGNALPVGKMPIGAIIHSLELTPGKGGQLLRGAGSFGIIVAKEEKYVQIKMASREIRRIGNSCFATIGQVDSADWKNINFGKAGRNRNLGIRPKVRGTAQNPRSHPHGGGEGRSGEGMNPKTPWGKSARGTRTRNKTKYSKKMIVSRRRK
ncbi:MAG: 50S ribosomal protein L2 [bacterium]|nr:50S ribosomal protein L2 [bacterium]